MTPVTPNPFQPRKPGSAGALAWSGRVRNRATGHGLRLGLGLLQPTAP
jgi:hypothetical protein